MDQGSTTSDTETSGAVLDPLDADYKQNISDIRSSIAESRKIAEDKSAALAGPRGELIQMARRPQPQPPVAKELPSAPKGNSAADDQTWMMVAGVLGSIAGGLTRRHVTNSLAAMTGALEGYTEGSRAKFEQNMKTWNAEAEKIRESNTAANDRYKEILASNRLAFEEKLQEIQMTAAHFDDRAAMQLAQTHDLDTLGRLIEQRMSHQEKMTEAGVKLRQDYQLTQERLENQRELVRMRLGIGQEGSNAENIAKAISEYRQKPYEGVAARSPQAAAIMNRVYELNPEYNGAKYPSISRSMTAFSVGKEGQMIRSMNVSILHLDTLSELSKALNNKDINTLNRIKQNFAEQFGRPMPTNFDAAKQIIGAEIVKAIVASGGGVAEREEARSQLDRARSPAQVEGVIQTYKKLLGGQLQGLRKQYEDTTGLKDFDQRLLPQAKSAYEGAGADISGKPAPSGDTLERIKAKLPQGWTVEPVQ